jgi:hypothetical protein
VVEASPRAGRQDVLAQEAGHGRGALGAGDDAGHGERAGTIDRTELPDLAHTLEVAHVEGVEEELLAGLVRADVHGPRTLDGPDLPEYPIGQWATFRCREALGRSQAREAPSEARPAEHVAHAAVADRPATEAGPGESIGDGALPVGGMLHRVGEDGIDERCGQASVRSLRRPRLRA